MEFTVIKSTDESQDFQDQLIKFLQTVTQNKMIIDEQLITESVEEYLNRDHGLFSLWRCSVVNEADMQDDLRILLRQYSLLILEGVQIKSSEYQLNISISMKTDSYNPQVKEFSSETDINRGNFTITTRYLWQNEVSQFIFQVLESDMVGDKGKILQKYLNFLFKPKEYEWTCYQRGGRVSIFSKKGGVELLPSIFDLQIFDTTTAENYTFNLQRSFVVLQQELENIQNQILEQKSDAKNENPFAEDTSEPVDSNKNLKFQNPTFKEEHKEEKKNGSKQPPLPPSTPNSQQNLLPGNQETASPAPIPKRPQTAKPKTNLSKPEAKVVDQSPFQKVPEQKDAAPIKVDPLAKKPSVPHISPSNPPPPVNNQPNLPIQPSPAPVQETKDLDAEKLRRDLNLAYRQLENQDKIIEILKQQIDKLTNDNKQLRGALKKPAIQPSGQKQQSKQSEKPKDPAAIEQLNLMQGLISPQKPNVKWQDIAGLKQAQQLLQNTIVLPKLHPNLFKGSLEPWKGILFYGPPGTGKTEMARACATECNSTFYCVTAADIMSKWLGDSQKMVRALFDSARAKKPSIIFIDEIDSLMGRRQQGQKQHSRKVINQFIASMQGLGSKESQGILVIGATNLPWEIDSAALSRFQQKIYIPLPDLQARKELIHIKLRHEKAEFEENKITTLAQKTKGLSGRDIRNFFKEASQMRLKDLNNIQNYKNVDTKDGVQIWMVCQKNDPPSVRVSPEAVDFSNGKNILTLREINYEDFTQALRRIKPSILEADLKRYSEWTASYGIQG